MGARFVENTHYTQMKKYIATLFLNLITFIAIGQSNRFRIDYDAIAILDQKTDTWSEWKAGNNTFVFNINNNKDVTHYKPNGSVAHYRNLSNDTQHGVTDNGYKYQLITILDEDGIKCTLQLFEDVRMGLKLIYSNVMIQFAKSD